MGFLTFKGGVHPFDGKDMSKECPTEKYLPERRTGYPVSQHIGAPAKPLVTKKIMCWRSRSLLKQAVLYPPLCMHPYPVQ